MNKTLISSALILVGISLTFTSLMSCSSNTRQENTTLGAVTGAVVGGVAGSAIGSGAGQVVAIGAGAIVGALIGGAIGQSMDSSDSMHTYHTMDYNPSNRATHWVNTKTGHSYTVVPTSKRFTLNGNPNCRHYRTMAVINGKEQQTQGIACRQADGSWKAVSA